MELVVNEVTCRMGQSRELSDAAMMVADPINQNSTHIWLQRLRYT